MIENGGEQIFTDHMLSTSRCALHLPLNERLTAAGRAFPAGNAANWPTTTCNLHDISCCCVRPFPCPHPSPVRSQKAEDALKDVQDKHKDIQKLESSIQELHQVRPAPRPREGDLRARRLRERHAHADVRNCARRAAGSASSAPRLPRAPAHGSRARRGVCGPSRPAWTTTIVVARPRRRAAARVVWCGLSRAGREHLPAVRVIPGREHFPRDARVLAPGMPAIMITRSTMSTVARAASCSRTGL